MRNIVAILLTPTAAFSYVNHPNLKWPMTIGVMAIVFPPESFIAALPVLALGLLARYLVVGLHAKAGRCGFGRPARSAMLLT